MIDFYATEHAYADHLVPIWHAMPGGARGRFIAEGGAVQRLVRLGVEPTPGRPQHIRPRPEAVVVAAFRDYGRVPKELRIALVEHGAGQTYAGIDRGEYAGGADREHVDLFVCPSERVAFLNRRRYQRSEVAVVGCPKLDGWAVASPVSIPVQIPGPAPTPTVAVTFHWPCTSVAQEADWAWPEHQAGLRELTEHYTVLGHAHPRAFDTLAPVYEKMGLEPVRDLDEVLGRADLLAFDNTSAGYEFAATDRPVVAMNCSRYRKDVHHGLRFWDLVPGLQAEPGDLLAMVRLSLAVEALAVEEPDCPEAWPVKHRRRVVEQVYAVRDGTSSQRAANAIMEVLA